MHLCFLRNLRLFLFLFFNRLGLLKRSSDSCCDHIFFRHALSSKVTLISPCRRLWLQPKASHVHLIFIIIAQTHHIFQLSSRLLYLLCVFLCVCSVDSHDSLIRIHRICRLFFLGLLPIFALLDPFLFLFWRHFSVLCQDSIYL
jgi:hypothetical protein